MDLHLCLLGLMLCLEIVQLFFHGILFVEGYRFTASFGRLILSVGRVERGLLLIDFSFKSQDLFGQIILGGGVDLRHVKLVFS